MLGAMKRCTVCSSSSFDRTPRSRATQCSVCHTIHEERARAALPEYGIISVAEEVHCAVTPDLQPGAFDGIPSESLPDDPYCTPGFLSAFRMLSPMKESVYGASAGTMCGDLAEMERLLANTLHLEDEKESAVADLDGNDLEGALPRKVNGQPIDSRHMIVAYFEIVDLANVLDIDRETVNLAVRLFEQAALSISMRNKHIESLAAATLPVALDLRHETRRTWLTSHPERVASEGEEYDPASVEPFPDELTISRVASASGSQVTELERDIRVVRGSLAQPGATKVEDGGASVPVEREVQAPSRVGDSILLRVEESAQALGLDADGRKLCCQILQNALSLDVCPRRAPISVAAASIYLGTQILGLRFTQAQVCRVLQVTEVTLRKVNRELSEAATTVVPDGYSIACLKQDRGRRRRRESKGASSDAPATPSKAVRSGRSSGRSTPVGRSPVHPACSAGPQPTSPRFPSKIDSTHPLIPSIGSVSRVKVPCDSVGDPSRSPGGKSDDREPMTPRSEKTKVDVDLSEDVELSPQHEVLRVLDGGSPDDESVPSRSQKGSARADGKPRACHQDTGGPVACSGKESKMGPKDDLKQDVERSTTDACKRNSETQEDEAATLEKQRQMMVSMMQDPEMVKAFASAMSMIPAFSALEPPRPPPLPSSRPPAAEVPTKGTVSSKSAEISGDEK